MTLLNIANDGYYSVLIVLYRALVVEGPTEQKKLIELCSDRTDQSRNRLRQTLNRWGQLGLFSVDNDMVSLAPRVEELVGSKKSLEQATATLPRIVRYLAFGEENNRLFWDREKSRSADLSRGISWVLAQNIYEFPFSNKDRVQEIELRQVRDKSKRIVQNDVHLNGLRSWAHYLGFSWQSKTTMVDPTMAILEELPRIFERQKEYLAETFVNQLASALPVLDGGRYRLMVEDVLDTAYWQKPSRPEVLSTALSRALWRLEVMDVLRLESRADAMTRFTLQRARDEEWKSFTHVICRGI